MEQNYLSTLDDIILSQNAVDYFYDKYTNDKHFSQWLDNTIPYIKPCEKQEQNNPWHKYNVLRHILHSVEEMNKQSKSLPKKDRKILAYTMFFHDMGKPEKHIVREKDGRQIDSFFDHNVRGAEIVEEILPKLGFNKEDTLKIVKLVYKHDIFMFIKEEKTNNPHWKVLTKDLILEEIKDLNKIGDGYKLMKYLVMVGRADNLAQNEKMTTDSLRLLDNFEKMLNEMV